MLNGGDMGTRQQKPKRRTPSKAAGRAVTEAGENDEGIESLRSAVNRELGKKGDQIAEALVERAASGHLESMKLAITVAKADKNTRKKRRGPSAVERLLLEPTREEPPETDKEDVEDASGIDKTHEQERGAQ